MDKTVKPAKKAAKTANKAVKPKRPAPTANAPSWPTQGTSAGIKRASAGHDRKLIGRGAARGR